MTEIGFATIERLTGFCITRDKDDIQAFAETFAPIAAVFEKELDEIVLFSFRQSEQPEKLRTVAGHAQELENIDTGEKAYCIGLSQEAVKKGEHFLACVTSHELAHAAMLKNGDNAHHGRAFRVKQSQLYRKYLQETGQEPLYDMTGPIIRELAEREKSTFSVFYRRGRENIR